ncbi:MAG: hypothetical protein QFX35_03500 [Candidatus Verstraetearchaeota archaeon]|nr:hypothetical protein [Candidatus Verstraetearchaeota archaeon]
MPSLREIVDEYMGKARGIEEHCTRCLRTERWGGSVLLMVVDASFTSIGLNYFTAVVPKVAAFRKSLVETGRVRTLKDLAGADQAELEGIWKNRRSWTAARGVASYLSSLPGSDRDSFRSWASSSKLVGWEDDPIGKVRGVGLVTYQYLRMMGGVDTVMPDKIVKRVINEILQKAGQEPVYDDFKFIEKTEEIAHSSGYRPIELCWMTWLVQPEGKIMRMEKYSNVLPMI